MTRHQVNTATLAGRIEELSSLQTDREGRPFVRFTLNSRKAIELTSADDVYEQHSCIARGRVAEQLAATVTAGATLLVVGSLFVNSRAVRRLDQRIAKVAVDSASVLSPAPTYRLLIARAAAAAEGENRFDARRLARNEVHLVGKVVAVDPDTALPCLTISTRVPFAATHDVIVWGEDVDEHTTPIGAIAEVKGLLSHHITPWSDGQIRLVSRVETEEVKILDRTHRAPTSPASVQLLGEPDQDPLRLN